MAPISALGAPSEPPNSALAIRVELLRLEEFRIYHELELKVPAGGLRISGPNGSGKSTIIDALLLLSTTRSRRGMLDADLINYSSGNELGVEPYASVIGTVDRAGACARLEVFLQRSTGRGTTRKLLRVADRARRASDVVGLLATVSFAPDDLDLILGAPAQRRRFLDVLLSQTDRQYLRCLGRYAKILSQRNGLLRQIGETQEPAPSEDQFAFWDEQLVALGAYLIAARARAVAALANHAEARYQGLAADVGTLTVGYTPTVQGPPDWWRGVVEADTVTGASQQIGAAFERQLRRSRGVDLARGSTTVGPHRDDLTVRVGGRELVRFGSRGQQRLAVVALKLAEIDVASAALGARPLLLLDDVLSELDSKHRDALLGEITHHAGQVIVTATDPALLNRTELAGLERVEVRDGELV